jgi:hypothetical protein
MLAWNCRARPVAASKAISEDGLKSIGNKIFVAEKAAL